MKLNNINGDLICEADVSTMKELVELAVKQKINLSEANLSEADLSYANLSGVDLPGVVLSQANLSGANLSQANLFGADLFGGNLYGANLSYANLTEAILSHANLCATNLYQTNLSKASLSEAYLSGADLSWANLSNARYSPYLALEINLYNIACPSSIRSLMILDAQSHPSPKLFDSWVKSKKCPYANTNILRAFKFQENKRFWPGWEKARKTVVNINKLSKAIFKELNITV